MLVVVAVSAFGAGAYVTYKTGSAFAGIITGIVVGVVVLWGWVTFVD